MINFFIGAYFGGLIALLGIFYVAGVQAHEWLKIVMWPVIYIGSAIRELIFRVTGE